MKATIKGGVYEGYTRRVLQATYLNEERVESVSIDTIIKNNKGLDFADKLAANLMYHSKEDWR
ncbi:MULTISPECIES: hypothetical protein [Bacillus]|uniref:hypothetical protein n=1 Tax=Bacillus TaxID=1386 RepID=UPI001E28775C|nr:MULTISPECIES: hypothetical protein [Bacillus]MDR4910739.1 hypothetical protein [Bacillus subtilis]UEG55516.1 hypothetical protein LK685_11655 [Bacillus sp. BC1-43]